MGIREFLQQHGVDFREGGQHRHVRPGWIGFDCPHCGKGTGKFHAGVTEDAGRAACWRCGGKRSLELLGEVTGIPWYEVREALGSNLTGLAPRLAGVAVGRGVKYPFGVEPLRRPHRLYLKERGFDPDVVSLLWGVQCIGPAGRLAWRLWIPIYSEGKVVSWTTRALNDLGRRYLSAAPNEEAVDHKTLLYGEDLAGHAVVVVEGPFDAWRIGPGAVATLGLQVTPAQAERIGRHPLRAICFDREPAALRRADKLATLLSRTPGETYFIELETGDDPANADDDEVEEIRRRFLD